MKLAPGDFRYNSCPPMRKLKQLASFLSITFSFKMEITPILVAVTNVLLFLLTLIILRIIRDEKNEDLSKKRIENNREKLLKEIELRVKKQMEEAKKKAKTERTIEDMIQTWWKLEQAKKRLMKAKVEFDGFVFISRDELN